MNSIKRRVFVGKKKEYAETGGSFTVRVLAGFPMAVMQKQAKQNGLKAERRSSQLSVLYSCKTKVT